MSYEPTNWKKGDKVTSTRLNKIENGIQGNDAEITDLKENLSDIFENKTIPSSPTLISEIDGINVKTGYNATDGSASIPMSPNSSYDSYWFVTQTDVDVWFSSISAGYFAFIVGGEYQSTGQSGSTFFVYCQNGATRYRKSDGNLPTESNKIHISAGCAVAFTMTAGAMESIYGLTEPAEIKVVKDSFKAEVVKRNYLKYASGSGADSSTEKVEVYIPTVSGYTKYDFLHTVNRSINADVWRVGYAYHVDDSFAIDYPLTTAGEWECAIKLDGRDDFSGGYAHGDEVMNNILFVVDGKPVDITTITTMTSFDDLCIVEDSDLYDPANHTTVYAKHGSEHHFTVDGLTIRQTIKFVLAETVLTAYLAMLPIAKTISNKVIPDNTFVPLSTDSAIRIYDTEKVIICKTDGKVKADFSVPLWEYWTDDDFTFLCLDNGGSPYNKCYFVNAMSTISIPQNKIFKSETKYNFVISE